MTDWTFFADAAADSALISLEPGVFRGELVRNDGAAVCFNDGAGGVAVVAADKEALIKEFETILERIKELPDPAPDAKCRFCGRAIRYPNAYDGPVWLHRPFETDEVRSDDWTEECMDEVGEPLELADMPHYSSGRYVLAQPATDPEAVPQVGDQVLDMHAINEEYPELAQVAVVWEVQYSGQIALDNDHLRTPDQLLVIERHVPEVPAP
jgi:hypothetical protein